MTDEIPIEKSDQSVEVEENIVEQEEPVAEPKRQRGRPKGTIKPRKEEPKAKPKKTPKPKVPTYESEDEAPEELEVRPIYDTRAIAAEVISMLSNRHLDRSAQKREKYRSWFQNPQY